MKSSVDRRQDQAEPRQEQQWRLNFDVLLVIAAYAHPRSLLNLACTCKHIWELVTDTSSVLIWKTSRSHVDGLPGRPADLTEQEYVDLAFRGRCHGCGYYAGTVFWEIRRRYCPACESARLCPLLSCHKIIQKNQALGVAHLTSRGEASLCVDKEQMESFMDEYQHSRHKKQLLSDRLEQVAIIREHARKCEEWYDAEQQILREERQNSIFERLEQLGYGPEIDFFRRHAIQKSRRFRRVSDTPKPLTNREWNQIWPKLRGTMKNFRLQRLEEATYYSRRYSLLYEYADYVKRPSSDTPSFDILPYVADVAPFPPFRDIIRAPEGTQMNDKPFESAFAQLPMFVDEWKKKLDAELAEMVQIPSHSSLEDACTDQVTESSVTTGPKPSQQPTSKLRLACAVFHGGFKGIFSYPDVLSTSVFPRPYPMRHHDKGDLERTGSIWDRFGIRYVKEAPYVVHACGLDPHLATAEDMNRRNARLVCITCGLSCAYAWREAIWHACSCHGTTPARWQLIHDDSEAMAEIRAAELADDYVTVPLSSRCLLCQSYVGDAESHYTVMSHLHSDHNIKRPDVKQGVHYLPIVMGEYRSFWKVRRCDQEPEEARFKANWSRFW